LAPNSGLRGVPVGHLAVGAGGIGAEAVLVEQQAAGGEQTPPEQIAPRDLTVRARLDHLGAVVAGLLGFSDAIAWSVLR
jgi:hypothetical protein